jgi:uncharacterized membrane protein
MLKLALRVLLALLMVFAGVYHFRKPDTFASIVPKVLPWPVALVYISGVFEILGGIGLLVPFSSRWAAWGLVALFIAVFPANINMAIHNIPINGEAYPIGSWVRLPLQGLLILWAWWFTK